MGKRRGKGEGGIYQRESDGKWCATVDLGFVNGKRRRKTVYGESRKEVADKLKVLHRDQAAGQIIVTERQTVAQFLDRWLETAVQPHRRTKTAASYEQLVRLYLKPHLGRHQLEKLSPEHVQTMINALLRNGGEGSRPLSARTVQYVRAVLRRALNQALKWGYVSRNVVTLTDTPKVPRHAAIMLSPAQSQHLLTTAAGHRLEALFTVALGLGLREGEVLGLRWIDIDVAQHTLRIAQTVQRVRGRLAIEVPKTDRSARLLPLPVFMERALARHAERQAAERRKVGDDWEDHGLVFPSERGTPLDPRNLLRQFKDLLVAAELPDMRFHDLRHSCATTLIAQGVHPRVVQEILGHSQISTTMNVYGHVLDATRRVAADAMDGIFLVQEPDELGSTHEPQEVQEQGEAPAQAEQTERDGPEPDQERPAEIRETASPEERYSYAMAC
jgi:integrase